MARNLSFLNGGGWAGVLALTARLEASPGPALEREAARHLADALAGVGPKQGRNILQMLGLTQFEIPLDSRIAKWLVEFGFPVHLSANALGDAAYYEFVLDGFQALCKAADILPCVMDAAIFVSFDEKEYGEDQLRW